MAKEYQKREEPINWKSLKTGNLFSYKDYSNIEVSKNGYLILPLDEYPYTITYEETSYGKWIKEFDK